MCKHCHGEKKQKIAKYSIGGDVSTSIDGASYLNDAKKLSDGLLKVSMV